ncbi:MAG: glycosyltransferase [Holophagales bacterium]|nr:glycosyltransferase [Holophagales bacterium]
MSRASARSSEGSQARPKDGAIRVRSCTRRARLAAVIVHYHAPRLVARAWAALERDAIEADLELEGVVVDNGSTPEEKQQLVALPPRWLDAGANLGYAGGANLGLAETTARLAVVLNPDVEVIPGCLHALVATLGSGVAAAGPRFFWDRPEGFLLPPTEPRSRGAELLSALSALPLFGRWARRRWRAHARRHWQAEEPLSTPDLSGALLALRRDAWEAVPFDADYPLYFEETDWLLRLRRAGWDTVYVPAARALHAYARSTRREPRSQGWFEQSERRFRNRHYGRRFTRLLEGLGSRLPPAGIPAAGQHPSRAILRTGEPFFPQLEAEVVRRIRWLELSPSTSGFPAAGMPVQRAEELAIAPELAELLEPDDLLWLRAFDARGRTLAVRQARGAASSGP